MKKLLAAALVLLSLQPLEARHGVAASTQGNFPIAIWLQNPTANTAPGYDSVVKAAKDLGINIFLQIDDGGVTWPSGVGTDSGQMAAMAAVGMKVIPPGTTSGLEFANNTAANSVASFQALNNASGGGQTLYGYNGGDEPNCGADQDAVPGKAATILGYDPTRPFFLNQLPTAFLTPGFSGCLASTATSIKATSVISFDLYSLTFPFHAYSGSNFISVPQDSLVGKSLAIQTARFHGNVGQSQWTFTATGNDAFGQAGQGNSFVGGINSNTTLNNNSGFSIFTSAWVGLTVSGTGIPDNTTIVSVTNGTTATINNAATATDAAVTVTLTGGDLNGCRLSTNLCLPSGNRYRMTPAESVADVWIAIVNGVVGIEIFCHDTLAFAYCLGGGGTNGAKAAASTLKYITTNLRRFGGVLLASTVGMCAMDSMNPTTGTGTPTVADTCTNGILTMATSDIAVPGGAIAKSFGGKTYVVAQPSRRGSAAMTYTLTGLANQTATIVYDTNSQFDPANARLGRTFTLNGSGAFTVTSGANSNDYQTLIFEIQ